MFLHRKVDPQPLNHREVHGQALKQDSLGLCWDKNKASLANTSTAVSGQKLTGLRLATKMNIALRKKIKSKSSTFFSPFSAWTNLRSVSKHSQTSEGWGNSELLGCGPESAI